MAAAGIAAGAVVAAAAGAAIRASVERQNIRCDIHGPAIPACSRTSTFDPSIDRVKSACTLETLVRARSSAG